MQSRCNRLVKGPLVVHAAPLDQNANTVANHPRFRKLALGCVVGIFKTDAFQPTRTLFGRRSLKFVLKVIDVSPFKFGAIGRPQPITIRKREAQAPNRNLDATGNSQFAIARDESGTNIGHRPMAPPHVELPFIHRRRRARARAKRHPLLIEYLGDFEGKLTRRIK